MTELIQVKADGALVEITFNRPDRKNALNNAMYNTLTQTLEALGADKAIRCILFTGAPGAYSAGNDVKEFISAPPLDEEAPVFRMLRVLSTSEKVLVAAVNGLAVGIGATMLLHCDLVVASSTATFQYPFINLAIVPEAASSLLLPRLIGHQRSMELLLLGEAIDAAQAHSYGFVNRVVPPDEVLPTARALSAKILTKPPHALRTIKHLVKSDTATIADRMRAENAALAARIVSAEGKEAVTALIEKRAPNFAAMQ
jgi:enoyl-CoA hydratase/carnithine racemase